MPTIALLYRFNVAELGTVHIFAAVEPILNDYLCGRQGVWKTFQMFLKGLRPYHFGEFSKFSSCVLLNVNLPAVKLPLFSLRLLFNRNSRRMTARSNDGNQKLHAALTKEKHWGTKSVSLF